MYGKGREDEYRRIVKRNNGEKMKKTKLCPTDLTWEEKNPSCYLFNNNAFIKLKKTIEKIKKERMEKK